MTILHETPTLDLFVPDVLLRKRCHEHNADLGIPCFVIEADDSESAAVCNKRAKMAGFNAPVSPQSLNRGKILRHKNKK